MANELRVVFDANVFVSALLLPRSVPRHALDWTLKLGKVLVSEKTLVELHEVLWRPKFDSYISAQARTEFMTALIRDTELVVVTESIAECRDAKDNMYLELSVSGKATHLITGDADLLSMNPFRDIAIIKPQKVLAELQRHVS